MRIGPSITGRIKYLPYNNMFLSDTDILKEVKNGNIVMRPFDESRLGPASYDILLGNIFLLNDAYTAVVIDPQKKIFAKTTELKLKDGQEFILRPGISVLGTSKDFFGSDHYLIQLSGKSSLARVGLMIHNTAGIVNPGHFLNITLEITNQNNIPIVLRPGMKIAQLTFSGLSSPPRQNYKDVGRFAKDNWKHYVPEKKAAKKSKK
ncbi:dCTP deaminase [Candidatus Kaiserbacteria bacterium]|nr:dCTP deaminase [Candidatus Kaiserbacteria bacterium]